MPILVHETEIVADPESVFEACRDVTKWPNFMPAVQSAKFLQLGETSDIVSITAEANDRVWTWQSRRTLSTTDWTIRFERLEPNAPISFFRGSWKVEPLDERRVRLRLSHEFETLEATNEMEEFLIASIKSNATRDLEALRKQLQKRSTL